MIVILPSASTSCALCSFGFRVPTSARVSKTSDASGTVVAAGVPRLAASRAPSSPGGAARRGAGAGAGHAAPAAVATGAGASAAELAHRAGVLVSTGALTGVGAGSTDPRAPWPSPSRAQTIRLVTPCCAAARRIRSPRRRPGRGNHRGRRPQTFVSRRGAAGAATVAGAGALTTACRERSIVSVGPSSAGWRCWPSATANVLA